MTPDQNQTWEERWHPLRREWVIVAAHREGRPWRGETVEPAAVAVPAYDPGCYLCPGNARVSGARNPAYGNVYVFGNDHPCVGPDAPDHAQDAPAFYQSRPAHGRARVVCYSPRHDRTFAQLSLDEVFVVLRTWQAEYRLLGARPEVNHVLTFENKGAVVGVSNPHPHGQIYATNFVFTTIETEAAAAADHHAATGRSLFSDVIRAEREDGRRIVADRDGALAFVPYFARYAYELYVAPERQARSIADLDGDELRAFASVLCEAVVRLDNLWRTPMPYVLTLHQQPTDGREHPGFHFHVVIQPPLRTPTLRKHLAGPEIGGGNFINASSPEAKAAELQAVSAMHYSVEG